MTRFEYLFRRFVERPSRLPQAVRASIGGRLNPRYKSASVTLRVGAGGLALGDNLMLTTVAREIRKRNPLARIQVVTNRPDVFARNPDVESVIPFKQGDRMRDGQALVTYKQGFPYSRHFVQYCCDCVSIPGPIDLRTYIYPAEEDHGWAEDVLSNLSAPPILISRNAGSHAYRKTWPLDSWKRLVTNLAPVAPVIDVGTAGQPLNFPPHQYQSLLGNTTVHQLAALMSRSQALVSVDSGTVHLAPAFDLPTVCLLGGVFPPVAIHYPHSRILIDRPPCSDCAPLRHCDFGAKCMSNLSVDEVLDALDELCPGIRRIEDGRLKLEDGGSIANSHLPSPISHLPTAAISNFHLPSPDEFRHRHSRRKPEQSLPHRVERAAARNPGRRGRVVCAFPVR